MTLLSLIKDLQKYAKKNGDQHIHSWKLSIESHVEEHFLLSPTRRGKNGRRSRATNKEFKEYVAKNKLKQIKSTNK